MTGPTRPEDPGGLPPFDDGCLDDATVDAILDGRFSRATAATGWAEVVHLIEAARGAPTSEELAVPAGVVRALSAGVGPAATDLSSRRRRSRQLRAVLAGAAVAVVVGGAAAAATGVLPLPGVSEDPPPSLPSTVVGDGPARSPAGPGRGPTLPADPAPTVGPDQVPSDPSTAPAADPPNGAGGAGDEVDLPRPRAQPGNSPNAGGVPAAGGLPPAAGGNGNGAERGNSLNAGGRPAGGP